MRTGRWGAVAVGALLLAGCGGGGGGMAITPPAAQLPAPTPTPAPAPPASSGFDDGEYRASDYAVAASALTAYQAGATGRGVKIAVIDSGIDASSPEIAGRVDRDSRGALNSSGHGHAVALIAAGARNGSGQMGVAFDATILSLGLSSSGGGPYSILDIARSIDVAVESGARVINMSLVGDTTRQQLIDAVQRASAAGIITVIAAGNGGGANPNGFALIPAQTLGASGLIVIAGAHSPAGQILSDRAGEGRDFYIAAQSGSTSGAAPVVSGALALLAQAFPNLTGAQLYELLLSSATDAGAPGPDGEFGRGLLNVARAFAPRGQTSLAVSGTPVSLGINGSLAPAMGDAGGSLPTIVVDGLGRAYRADLGSSLAPAADEQPLARALMAHQASASAAIGTAAMSLTVGRETGSADMGFAAATGPHGLPASRPRGGSLRLQPTPRLSLTLGTAPAAALAPWQEGAFLAARDPAAASRFDSAAAIAARQVIGTVGVTVGAERGRVALPRVAGPAPARFASTSVTLDVAAGPLTLRGGIAQLDEARTVLGGWFSPALAAGGARSRFADLGGSLTLPDGWRLQASYRRGWTWIETGVGLVAAGRLTSDGFAIDVARAGLLTTDDRLSLRLAQPLRVTGGGLTARGIDDYDVMTGAATFGARRLDLAPAGREIAAEVAYARRAAGGWLSLHGFLRRDPGHIDGAAADLGVAARLSVRLPR